MARKQRTIANDAETFIDVTWDPNLVSVPRNNRYCAVACDVRNQGFRNTRVYESKREGMWIVSGVKGGIRHYAYLPSDLVARIRKFDSMPGNSPRKIGGSLKTWKLEVFRAEAVRSLTEDEKQRAAVRNQKIKTGEVIPERRFGNTAANVNHGRFPAA